MFKRLFLLLFLVPAGIRGMIYLPKGITFGHVHDYAASKKIIFAWDVHGVLAKKDGAAKAKVIIKHLPAIGLSKLTGPDAWDEIDSIPKDQDISGQGIAAIFNKHGQTAMAKMAQEGANAYKPRAGMATIVHEMKLLGFTQRFASNIGDAFLKNLSTKFKNKYKIGMLDMILPGKVIDYSQLGARPLKKPLPAHLTQFCKPGLPFFQDFIDTYNTAGDQIIIFIDDKLENIKAAVSKGFVGIHVNATLKDNLFVKQLRNAFQTLQIYGKK